MCTTQDDEYPHSLQDGSGHTDHVLSSLKPRSAATEVDAASPTKLRKQQVAKVQSIMVD